MASVVDEMVDALAEAERPLELVAAFTRPLPVAVISRLMGLDGLDLKRLAHWSDHALATTAYTVQEVQEAMKEFGAFGAQLVAERRRHPARTWSARWSKPPTRTAR